MRISTSQLFAQSLNRITDLQSKISDIQNHIASGRRITQPGDDPVGAATVLQIGERMQALTQFDRNGVQAEQRLNQVDDVMSNASTNMQRVQELLLQGRSEALGASDRRAIATEVRERLDILVDLGNSRNASGEYLFAGGSVTTRPFTRDATGNVSYNGDQTTRRIQISEGRSVEESFAGDLALFAVRNGNGSFATAMAAGNTGTAQIDDNVVINIAAFQTHDFRISFTSPTTYDVIDDTLATTIQTAQPYTDGGPVTFSGMQITVFGTPATGDEFLITPSRNQSMFETINEIAVTLETGFSTPAEAARFGFDLDRSIENLAQAAERISALRATTGARLNSIELQRNLHEDVSINLQTLRSELEDVDLAEAISIFSQQMTALEAAQATFVRVQGLSLFNFL